MYTQSYADREQQIKLLPSGKRAFVGRQDLLDELDRWYEDHTRRSLQVVADGGAGKTALIHHWLSNSRCFDPALTQASPKLAVHSFYGQAKAGRTSVEEGLIRLLEALDGPKAEKTANSKLIARIAEACSSGPCLIILDGFETQQDLNGLIQVEYLLMEELFVRLADLENCKIIVTSRMDVVDSAAFGEAESHTIRVPGLTHGELLDLFLTEFPDAEKDWLDGKVRRCFPDRTQALVATLALNALVEAGSVDPLLVMPPKEHIESTSPNRVPLAVSELVERSYNAKGEDERFILRLVALADEEVSSALCSEFSNKFGQAWSPSAFGKVASMRLVISREVGLDMHPRIRECLSALAKRSDLEDFRRIGIALARRSEELANKLGESNRRVALWAMHRAIVYRLRAGDIQNALETNYFGFFSAEPNPAMPVEPVVWRSIKQDMAYALENETLSALVEAVSKACEHEPQLHRAHAGLKQRHFFVRRSSGLIEKADLLGTELAVAEDASQKGAMTAQMVLTKLIKGQVDNPPNDVHGAAFWSEKSFTAATEAAPSSGVFPQIRALVYKGAYLHRLNRPDEALVSFKRAAELQSALHKRKSDEPRYLVGLNGFLFLWFLIESREFDYADKFAAEIKAELASKADGSQQTKQWGLMLDLPLAWLRQEQALAASWDGQTDKAKVLKFESEALLAALGTVDAADRWAIPYDMRSVYVRTELRSRIISSSDIDGAMKELKHRSHMYERAGAVLFAADCQADLMRLYASADHFPEASWQPPAASAVQASLAKLGELSCRYPLAGQVFHRATPLQQLRSHG